MKIVFDQDGFSKMHGSIPEGDEYDVAKSRYGYKLVDGSPVALTAEEYSDRYDDYKQKRQKEFPPIGDQLDEIWKSLEALGGFSDMLTAIKATKAKHPKN